MSAMNEWSATSEAALVKGITLIEASAGTGKTYNIASLVLRLVAEQGVKIEEIVVVTFTRAATAELKERIRERLVRAVETLEGRRPPGDDDIVNLLLAGDPSLRASRLRSLRAAEQSFDACLISTIHGFCQRMLAENAFEAQTDFGLELMAETHDVREQLIDDWLSAHLYPDDPKRFAFLRDRCRLDRKTLVDLADLALRDPGVDVVPRSDEVTVAGWEAERDAFVGPWERQWAPSLPALYEQAHLDKVFAKPRQSTYRAKKCAENVAVVTEWLRGRPSLLDACPAQAYWSAEKVRGALAPGRQEPTSEALVALRHLLGHGDRAAACERAAFVQWARAEFARRMRAQRAQSFADLMRNLARVLAPPGGASRDALVHAIGSRFKAALIDEFQDTDALQWGIFRGLFGDRDHWLYLIGDPKQAIYGFRGADVHVYLQAKETAGARCFTMRTNFRSDARIMAGFNHWMARAGFFAEPGIDCVRVEAARRAGQPVDRIRYDRAPSAAFGAPLQLRFVDRRLGGALSVSDSDEALGKGEAEASLPVRVADDIVELLESGAEIYDRGRAGTDEAGFRALGPGDIAVLTRTGLQAIAIQDALARAGIASVLQGARKVLESEEALELQRWLRALAAPGDDRPARAAATTHLFGRNATLLGRVDAQDPEALRLWEQWLSRLARWRESFAKFGFFRTLRAALRQDLLAWPGAADGREDATTRLMRRPDGERRLTNVWHLAELLHEAETAQKLHLAGLLAWLARERARATADAQTAETRIERDDEAVSIMNMHKCKGLEFPVVFVPYLWDGRGPHENDALLVAREDGSPVRVLDVRTGADRDKVFARACRETQKEQIRLLYVACTRARHRCVVYAGHIERLEESSLAPALHGEPAAQGDDRIATGTARTGSAARSALWDDLARLAAGSGAACAGGAPAIALSACEAPSQRTYKPPEQDTSRLEVRDFARFGLDRAWRRHSYSSLAHGASGVPAPMLEDEGVDRDAQAARFEERDGPSAHVPLPTYAVPEHASSVPLADFPAGTEAGTFLHALFEKADFQWAHPALGGQKGAAELRELIEVQLSANGLEKARWADVLHAAMLDMLRTPLGGALGDTCLCDIPAASRLNELRFDFPIAGGSGFGREPHTSPLVFEALARALRRRKSCLSGHDDEATMRTAYLERLQSFGDLAGFMTGSMDLVFRHPVDGKPKWFLADYKSNRLDPFRSGTCFVESFCLDGMRYAMETSNYYLQYHIYVLALHRYLRARLGAGYSYADDLGGVYYLFLRGMVGTATPIERGRRHGCFFDKPPFEVVEALDRVFVGPTAAGSGGEP